MRTIIVFLVLLIIVLYIGIFNTNIELNNTRARLGEIKMNTEDYMRICESNTRMAVLNNCLVVISGICRGSKDCIDSSFKDYCAGK